MRLSSRVPLARSPTEMPVPTDVPTPTSPAEEVRTRARANIPPRRGPSTLHVPSQHRLTGWPWKGILSLTCRPGDLERISFLWRSWFTWALCEVPTEVPSPTCGHSAFDSFCNRLDTRFDICNPATCTVYCKGSTRIYIVRPVARM